MSIGVMILTNLLTIAGAALVRYAAASTQQHVYEFNAVAMTGGGYITGIFGHPTEPGLMYARTDIGSAYRWDQTLDKWVPLTDFISEADTNLFGTESIALDPNDPDMLYLAQGQYLTSANSAVFVSSNRGATFDVHPTPFLFGSNELGRNNGERLAVNPFDGNELWVGTRQNGLWKSTNRAKTWTNVTCFPDAFANGIGIVSVVFDPKNKGVIYASANVPEGIYVTRNAGATWKPLPGQPKEWEAATLFDGLPPASKGPQPMKVALASNNVLYVTYGDGPGPYGVNYGYVYKYSILTSEWTNITPTRENSQPPPFTPQAFPRGGYCGLSVDRKDPETLVVVSLDRDPGPALDSMYFSHDGGNSWKDVTQITSPPGTGGYWGHPIRQAALKDGIPVPWLSFDWTENWGGYGSANPIKGLAKFGWWMTAVLIDPFNSNHVMYGTGATIWSTDEITKVDRNRAPHWYIQAQGIEETVCLSMISPSGGDAHLITGEGDIMGFVHKDLDKPQHMFAQPTWSNTDTLDFAGGLPTMIVRAGDTGLNYTNGCRQAAYSKDGGDTWEVFGSCAPGINMTTTVAGVMAIDASGKHVVWSTLIAKDAATTPDQTGPWATSNLGKTWVAPKGLQVQTANISADRVQPATFYSFTNQRWHISTDGGVTYRSSPASRVGLPATASGGLPVANFAKAGELWIALNGFGLYHSTNFGSHWNKLGGDGVQPQLFGIGAAAPRAKSPALFLWGTVETGGAVGLYRSDDNGESWARVNDDAHQYGGPRVISGDPRVYGRVFIGTGGRGTLYADIKSGQRCDAGGGCVITGTQGI